MEVEIGWECEQQGVGEAGKVIGCPEGGARSETPDGSTRPGRAATKDETAPRRTGGVRDQRSFNDDGASGGRSNI